AAQTSSPARLRLLFVHILANCEVRDPQSLCAFFAADLAEDLAEASPLRDILLLALLERELQRLDKSLIHYGWTALQMQQASEAFARRSRRDGAPACHPAAELQKARSMREVMHPDQASFFDAVAFALQRGQPLVAFLDGPALISLARGHQLGFLATAWSGAAASLLPEGRTCHSAFGLPVPVPADACSSSLRRGSARANILRNASIIAWDEVWRLTHNFRAAADPTYSQALLDIGNGAFQADCDQPDVDQSLPTLESFCGNAILTMRNADVDTLNDLIADSFDASAISPCYSADEVHDPTPEAVDLWPQDFLRSLTPPSMPPHLLRLHVGSLVMLLRNIDVPRGLCNGVRCVVLAVHKRVLDVILATGP
ncbi:unnamed protein product, partial [Effrenium voratum]